jgi:hypothetical protein
MCIIIIIFIKFHKSSTGAHRPAGYRTSYKISQYSVFYKSIWDLELGRAVANPHIRDKSMPTDRGNVKVFS